MALLLSTTGPSPGPGSFNPGDDIGQELRRAQDEIRRLENCLRIEQSRNSQLGVGVQELRTILNPLYLALQAVFGELDPLTTSSSVSSSGMLSPQAKAAWDNWKSKLGGLPSRFIDALMLHGPMTQTQLRIAVGCAARSVTNVVYTLNKAGLINKSGGKISLKEL